MNAADVFCLPSHREGCPNVILEAMNCGCRVVATAVGGIPELVDQSMERSFRRGTGDLAQHGAAGSAGNAALEPQREWQQSSDLG